MTTATRYVDAADIAKYVRRDLKVAFPGVKFHVRTSKYSGGASIDVSWVDGPTVNAVERVIKRYEGARFDGMIDLKSHVDVVVDGETVHGMADFIFGNRAMTNEAAMVAHAAGLIRARCATDGTPPHDRFGNFWVTDLARAMVFSLSYPERGVTDADWDRVYRMVALGEREEVAG